MSQLTRLQQMENQIKEMDISMGNNVGGYASFESKGLKEWGNKEVVDWIEYMKFGIEFEKKLLSIVKPYGIDGASLLCVTQKSLNEDWNLSLTESLALMIHIERAIKQYRSIPNLRIHKNVKLTESMDVISRETVGPARLEMSCGHGISANSLYQYIAAEIQKPNRIDIICPVEKCGKIWDWELCLRYADLSKEEIIYFNKLRTDRMCKDFLRACPTCGRLVCPPRIKNTTRSNCGHGCVDFCYKCGLKWKSTDTIQCGNGICGKNALNEILLNSPWKKSSGLTSLMPAIRACPDMKCSSINRHKDACKHVECGNCGKSFCFRCLCMYKDGKWECGPSAYGACEVKDIQQFKRGMHQDEWIIEYVKPKQIIEVNDDI